MHERKHYVHISFDKGVADWVKPIVDSKAMGYESLTEFVVQAVREKLDYYLEIGIHPWSHAKRTRQKEEGWTAGKAALILLIFVGFVGILSLAFQQKGFTGMLTSPIPAGTDFIALYNEYWLFLDFLIYTTIFVSTAYATVGRMFKHSGIAIGIGTMLAVGMLGMEAAYGFAIRDLGTLAATVLTIILGASLYHTFRKLHFDLFGAASVTSLLVYLGIIILIPPVYSWFRHAIPGLGFIITITFCIGIYHLATRAYRLHTEPNLELLPPIVRENVIPELEKEQEFIKAYLSKITPKTQKNTHAIIEELASIYRVLSKFGNTPTNRQVITQKLKAIIPQQSELNAQLDETIELVSRIKAIDIKLFKTMQSALKKLKPAEKRHLQQEIAHEIEKLNAETKLEQFEQRINDYNKALQEQIKNATQHLNQNNLKEAQREIANAIQIVQEAQDIQQEMKTLEELLLEITKKEIKTLKPKQ